MEVTILRYEIASDQEYLNRNTCNCLAPGGGCEVLFSPCLSVCVYVRVSGQYFGILFLGY